MGGVGTGGKPVVDIGFELMDQIVHRHLSFTGNFPGGPGALDGVRTVLIEPLIPLMGTLQSHHQQILWMGIQIRLHPQLLP